MVTYFYFLTFLPCISNPANPIAGIVIRVNHIAMLVLSPVSGALTDGTVSTIFSVLQ